MNLTHRMLAETASEFGATIVSHRQNVLEVDLTIVRPSGTPHEFSLEIGLRDSKPVPVVSEREPRQFPAFCSDRHINYGGTFCIGWGPGDPDHVTSIATAQLFWSRLSQYLELQLVASATRRWPGARRARAHGDAAAPQDAAERIAKSFGPRAFDDLIGGVYRIAETGKGLRATLDLYRREALVAKVHRVSGFLMNPDAICICDEARDTGRPVSQCSDHRYQIPRFARAVHSWHREHVVAVRAARDAGLRCCGTLEQCELRALPPRKKKVKLDRRMSNRANR